MESKLAAVLAEQATGGAVPVTEICANLGISRQTYYKYRRRYLAEGLTGLEARSRRPLTSPTLTAPEPTERVIRARKRLYEEGWDNGALSIWYWLLREGGQAPPAVRTIHRVLVRAGLVDPDPSKARRSRRRFQFPASDDCWQFDAFEYALADGTFVVVFEIVDDHSRYLVANLAWPGEDTAGAWQCLLIAVRRYQVVPFMVLTDNGLAFSGKRHHGYQVLFERKAIELGIKPITARPYHPQTNGKNERHHGTTKRWLQRRPLATTIAELQQQLDTYRDAYNHQRPHQSLAGATPAEKRAAGVRRAPHPSPTGDIPARTATVTDAHTNNRGYVIGLKNHRAQIPLGAEHAGKRLTIVDTGGHLLIFDRHHLLRDVVVDPTRRYQPMPVTPAPRSATDNPTPPRAPVSSTTTPGALPR